jgi:hypothetical protein
VLLAVLLSRGGGSAAPTTSTRRVNASPATTAPPAPSGPLSVAAVGTFSTTVGWQGADPPARVAYGLPELGPTLWAPLRGNQAELTGLRFGTTYRV